MKGARGFTLVEALVAFAILAATLIALYGALGTSLAGIARASRHEDAVLVAESRLAELNAIRALPALLEGAVDGTGFRWRIEAIADDKPEPPEIAASPLRPQRIKLAIFWEENGAKREIIVERQLLLWREPQ
jgi:general secretion pathway protein I